MFFSRKRLKFFGATLLHGPVRFVQIYQKPDHNFTMSEKRTSIKIANAIFSRKFDANVIILLFLVHEVPDYFVGNGDIAYD